MRDIELKRIRPIISTIEAGSESSDAERFQNETLRPILKMQNELMAAVFRNFIEKRKGVFRTLSREKQFEYVSDSLRKDLKFRNLLVGIVLGHFTLEEWSEFEKNNHELSRRIVNMLIERLQSQIEEL